MSPAICEPSLVIASCAASVRASPVLVFNTSAPKAFFHVVGTRLDFWSISAAIRSLADGLSWLKIFCGRYVSNAATREPIVKAIPGDNSPVSSYTLLSTSGTFRPMDEPHRPVFKPTLAPASVALAPTAPCLARDIKRSARAFSAASSSPRFAAVSAACARISFSRDFLAMTLPAVVPTPAPTIKEAISGPSSPIVSAAKSNA